MYLSLLDYNTLNCECKWQNVWFVCLLYIVLHYTEKTLSLIFNKTLIHLQFTVNLPHSVMTSVVIGKPTDQKFL